MQNVDTSSIASSATPLFADINPSRFGAEDQLSGATPALTALLIEYRRRLATYLRLREDMDALEVHPENRAPRIALKDLAADASVYSAESLNTEFSTKQQIIWFFRCVPEDDMPAPEAVEGWLEKRRADYVTIASEFDLREREARIWHAEHIAPLEQRLNESRTQLQAAMLPIDCFECRTTLDFQAKVHFLVESFPFRDDDGEERFSVIAEKFSSLPHSPDHLAAQLREVGMELERGSETGENLQPSPVAPPASLTSAIEAYADGMRRFETVDTEGLANEQIEALTTETYVPPLKVLEEWEQPAGSWDEALMALRFGIREMEVFYDDSAALRMIKAAFAYFQSCSTTDDLAQLLKAPTQMQETGS